MSVNVTKTKLIGAVSALALQTAFIPAIAHADSLSDLKAELAIIQGQINSMQTQSVHYTPAQKSELDQVKAEVAELKLQLAQTQEQAAAPRPALAVASTSTGVAGTGVLPEGGLTPKPHYLKPIVGGIPVYQNQYGAFYIAGDIDGGVRLDTGAGHSILSVQSGLMRADRLTLEGYQNIGYGLRVVGVLEGGFNAAEGEGASNPDGITGFDFGRESFAGIGNDKYGYVDFGRQYAPIWAVSAAPWSDPFAGNYLGGVVALDPTMAVNSRVSNAITYNYGYTWEGMLDPSPPVGIGFAAMYAPGETNGTSGYSVQSGQQFGASASYGTKHWWIGGGYQQIDGINLSSGEAPYSNTYIPTLPTTQKTRLIEETIAASYVTPWARLTAEFNTQYDGRKVSLNDGVDQDDWFVGAVVPTLAHQNFKVSYGTFYNHTDTKAQYSMLQTSYEYDLVKAPGTALFIEDAVVFNNKHSAQGLLGAQDVGGAGPAAILPTQLTTNGTKLGYGDTANTLAAGVRYIF